jgi:hypothetical protein
MEAMVDGSVCGPKVTPHHVSHAEAAITILITHAVASQEGRLRLATAEEYLIGELECNRFNTERAVEVYRFAIGDSVWACLKDSRVRRLMFRDYLRSGLGKQSQLNSLRNLRRVAGVTIRKVAGVLRLLRTNVRLGDFAFLLGEDTFRDGHYASGCPAKLMLPIS